jgi:hypothetical protein
MFSQKSQGSKGRKSKDKGNSSKGKSSKDRSKKQSTREHQQTLNLWCAIYTPHFGNYYHWAFAVSDQANGDWHIFEVVQEEQDGPFTPVHRQANPANSARCHQPLTFLGQVPTGQWATLFESIRTQGIGEALDWNCQDYVLEIWDSLQISGVIDHASWEWGRSQMLPFYGQDFGNQGDDEDDDEDDGEDDDGDEDEQGERQILSEEFIDNSSSDS